MGTETGQVVHVEGFPFIRIICRCRGCYGRETSEGNIFCKVRIAPDGAEDIGNLVVADDGYRVVAIEIDYVVIYGFGFYTVREGGIGSAVFVYFGCPGSKGAAKLYRACVAFVAVGVNPEQVCGKVDVLVRYIGYFQEFVKTCTFGVFGDN